MGLMAVTHNILILPPIKLFYRAYLTPFSTWEGVRATAQRPRDVGVASCGLFPMRDLPSTLNICVRLGSGITAV